MSSGPTPQQSAPTCTYCPQQPLSKLAPDSASWICMVCDRVYGPGGREADEDPPTEVLMQAPVTPERTGSGRSRGRRDVKPGERQAREESRRERRYEQDAFSLGRPDSEGMKAQLAFKCDPSMRDQVREVARLQKKTTGQVLRESFNLYLSQAARHSQARSSLRA